MIWRIVSAAFLTFALYGIVCSQTSSPNDGTGIRGEVVDYKIGAMIVNAKINISNKSIQREVRSDSSGQYEIALPVGVYTVEVESLGFQKLRRKDLKIEGKGLFTFNVNMDWDKNMRVDQEHP